MATISQTVNIEMLEKLPDGTYKKKNPATVAGQVTQDANNRFVTDAEKSTWNGKVDKVAGKGLSTEDYTTAEKTKLAGVATGANNYTHPATHPPSIITQDASNRFVTDAEKSAWNYSEFSSVATNQDDDGTYKAVEWKRVDNTVYARSTLIGTAPYGQVKVDYYDTSGVSIIKTITWDLTYDDNEFPYKREVDA